MRRLFIVSLGFCAALSAQGALLNTATDHVMVPCFKGGFEFGLTGAYMRADSHQVAYAFIDKNNNGVPDGNYLDIESEYSFAWGAMAGWRFANSANDLRLSYFNASTEDSDSAVRGDHYLHPSAGTNNFFWYENTGQQDEPIDVSDASFLRSAKGHNELDLTAIDLEFAQHMDVGTHTSMRFFVGVSRHELEKESRIVYNGAKFDESTESSVQISENVRKLSEFTGFGPRIGFDTQYAFNNGFGLVGHFSTSILFGELDSKTSSVQTSVTGNQEQEEQEDVIPQHLLGNGPDSSSVNIKSRHLVVPNVDLRLGIDYSYAFAGGSIMTAELGYWGKSYFGGLNETTMSQYRHTSQADNVTFHGAYLTLLAHL